LALLAHIEALEGELQIARGFHDVAKEAIERAEKAEADRDGWADRYKEANAAAVSLAEKLVRLREALRQLEWLDRYDGAGILMYRFCPACGAPDRPDFIGPPGHTADCWLANVLRPRPGDLVPENARLRRLWTRAWRGFPIGGRTDGR